MVFYSTGAQQDGRCTYDAKIEGLRVIIFAVGKR